MRTAKTFTLKLEPETIASFVQASKVLNTNYNELFAMMLKNYATERLATDSRQKLEEHIQELNKTLNIKPEYKRAGRPKGIKELKPRKRTYTKPTNEVAVPEIVAEKPKEIVKEPVLTKRIRAVRTKIA